MHPKTIYIVSVLGTLNAFDMLTSRFPRALLQLVCHFSVSVILSRVSVYATEPQYRIYAYLCALTRA